MHQAEGRLGFSTHGIYNGMPISLYAIVSPQVMDIAVHVDETSWNALETAPGREHQKAQNYAAAHSIPGQDCPSNISSVSKFSERRALLTRSCWDP